MNYFNRIVHNTVGPVYPSIRPAVNPESIPETPVALGEKLVPPSVKAGKIIDHASKTPIPFGGSATIKNNKAPPSYVSPATDERQMAVKGDVLPNESQSSPSADHLLSSDPPSQESKRIQSTTPIEDPLSKEHELLPVKNSDVGDNAMPVVDDIVAEKRVKTGRLGLDGESVAHMEVDEDSPEPSLLNEPQILEGKEKTNDKLSDVQHKPQRASIAPRQASSLLTGPKADLLQEDMEQAYPSQLTTRLSKTRYSEATNQSEETVVMINIGRIDVNAEVPAKPALKNKFSPVLSLADYLKQRSEGKIG
jgi:hypothetical protein